MLYTKSLTILALAFALAACNSGCEKIGGANPPKPVKPDAPEAPDTDGDGKPDTPPVEKTPAVKVCNIASAKCYKDAKQAKEHWLIDCPDSECTSRIEKAHEAAKEACEKAYNKCLDDACSGKKAPKAKTRKVKKAKLDCPKQAGDAGKPGDCVIDGVPNPTEAQCETFDAEAEELDADIEAGAAAATAPDGDQPLR